MAVPIGPVKIMLAILSAAGFYGTWILLINNGTAEMMAHIRDIGPRLLPGTKEVLKTSYTGFGWIDYQLTVLTCFFYGLVDGSMPQASLQAFHFAGQFPAAYIIAMMEGMRKGNRGKLVTLYVLYERSSSFTTLPLTVISVMIWGVLVQNMAYAVFMPLYLLLHLSTSSTVTSPTPTNIAIEIPKLSSIPISMTLGYVVPSILMALPAPSVISFETKQYAIAIWQAFPIWVELFQQAISTYVFLRTFDVIDRFSPPTMDTNVRVSTALTTVYVFALALAGLTHIPTITLTAVSVFFPDLFALEYKGVFDPKRVFIPAGISPATKMSTIAAGALNLMQYDEFIGSAALVIWSAVLFMNACSMKKRFDGWLILVGEIVVLTTVAGPVGCAVALIWARDELVLSEVETDEKKVI